MRDGKHVSTDLARATSASTRWCAGWSAATSDALFPKQDVDPGAVVLEVDGLTRDPVFDDISFEVRAGEIVALAGLVGSGRSEVVQSIFGVDPRDAGTVEVARQDAEAGIPTQPPWPPASRWSRRTAASRAW